MSQSAGLDLVDSHLTATIYMESVSLSYFSSWSMSVKEGWLRVCLWSVHPAVTYAWEYGTICIIINSIRAASKQIISRLNNFAGLYHTSLNWSPTPIISDMNCVSIISSAQARWGVRAAPDDLVLLLLLASKCIHVPPKVTFFMQDYKTLTVCCAYCTLHLHFNVHHHLHLLTIPLWSKLWFNLLLY